MDPVREHITALIEKYEKRIETIKNPFFVNTYESGRADGDALIEKYEKRSETIKNTFFVNTYESGRADGALSELEEVIEDLKCVRDAVDA